MKNFAKYSLIDLHLHLDGSLSPEWMFEWAEKQNIPLPAQNVEQLLPYISAPQDCTDLNQYLNCFAIPVSLLQSPEAITSAVFDLVKRLDQQGLAYVEIRFAPQLHTQKGLTQSQVIEAALAGLQAGLSGSQLFKANLILCCLRGIGSQAGNLETIQMAKHYLSTEKAGVVAVDLAGPETGYPTKNFVKEFELAKSLGVPFTIHAGEAAGAENVQQAIELGASRIGHGIRAAESESVMQSLAENHIGVEMCPCSNLQTKAINDLKNYPLRTFLMKGIIATLNTDNMTVSQTCIRQEFDLLTQEYQLMESESQQLLENAIRAAFLSEEEKRGLKTYIKKRFEKWVKDI
ncbi:adenosine deaminase [Rodentibacter myodis]|uniref:Adenosine deaminase n=1 Tax=Rodentibacter myodis TaxID=1907939 RepID=A0A1V3JPJ5_9PAST|nr:adenosine deaminase [Rodentibacter myodis]OOF58337.1 adenosine deaminase [Rodentibacter myodis]